MAHIEQQTFIKLPWSAARLRLVNESFPVIGGIVRPVPSQPLIKYLTETPGEPIMAVDPAFEGKDSLYVAIMTSDDRDIQLWLNRMTYPHIHVNTRGGDTFIAAPFRAFTP